MIRCIRDNRLIGAAAIAVLLILPATSGNALAQWGTQRSAVRGRAAGEEPREFPHLNHVVQPGETLFSISERYYGSGYEWPRILEYNNFGIDPERLIIGSTIFVPEPRRGSGRGFLEGLFGSAKSSAAPEPQESRWPASRQTLNPGGGGGGNGIFGGFFGDLASINLFGYSFGQMMGLLSLWFLLHLVIQGSFIWFGAHVAFVKDVSFKKALRATLQAEMLAMAFLVIVGFTGLLMVYVGTAPPGKPVLADLFQTVEDAIGTPTGLTLSSLAVVVLYVFLGIRFIPQSFGVASSQGIIVVVLSVLLPHMVFLYLVGARMGFIG